MHEKALEKLLSPNNSRPHSVIEENNLSSVKSLAPNENKSEGEEK